MSIRPRTFSADCALVRLNPFDVPEPLEFVEEEAVTAPNIENPARQTAERDLLDHIQDEGFPCSPPPMSPV